MSALRSILVEFILNIDSTLPSSSPSLNLRFRKSYFNLHQLQCPANHFLLDQLLVSQISENDMQRASNESLESKNRQLVEVFDDCLLLMLIFCDTIMVWSVKNAVKNRARHVFQYYRREEPQFLPLYFHGAN